MNKKKKLMGLAIGSIVSVAVSATAYAIYDGIEQPVLTPEETKPEETITPLTDDEKLSLMTAEEKLDTIIKAKTREETYDAFFKISTQYTDMENWILKQSLKEDVEAQAKLKEVVDKLHKLLMVPFKIAIDARLHTVYKPEGVK